MSDGINDSHAYFEGAAIAGKSPRRQLAEMGDRHTIEASQLADSSTDVCRIAEVLAARDKRYAALQQQLEEAQKAHKKLFDEHVELLGRTADQNTRLAAVTAERDAAKQSSAGLLMSFYSNKCDNESQRAELAAAIREKEILREALEKIAEGCYDATFCVLAARRALASASTAQEPANED